MKLAALNEHAAAARLRVDALEQELAAAYLKALRAAGRKAASRFRGAASLAAPALTAATDPKWLPPDPGQLLDADQLAAQAKKNAAPVQERALRLAVPVGIAFDLEAPLARQFLGGLADRTNRILNGFSDEIGTAIGEAHDQGLSIPKAAQLLRDRVESASLVQATLLARSDLVSIANGGSLLAAQLVSDASAGAGEGAANFKTWLTAGDERVRDTHAEADGQTVPLDQPFDVGGESLNYPGDPQGSDSEVLNCRCVAPGTRLSDARVAAAMRRPFEGHLWRITTASGRELAVTANHPILTRAGWKAAHLLREGDDLVCCASLEVGRAEPDVDDVPAFAHQVFAALDLTPAGRERVELERVNFHGDVADSDVDVAVGHDLLTLEGDPTLGEEFAELAFALAHREMCTNGDAAALVSTGEPLDSGFVSGPQGATVCFHERRDRRALDPVPAMECEHAHPGVVVSKQRCRDGFHLAQEREASGVRTATTSSGSTDIGPDGHRGDAEAVGDLLVRLPGRVELDPLVDLSRIPFVGHVYNFTAVGGTYSAEGIVTANCTLIYGDSMSASAVRAPTPALSSRGTMDETPEVTPAPLVLRDFHLTAAAGEPTRWQATLLVEDEPTEDGRMIAANGATWRPLPLPLSILDDSSHSDTGEAPVCGRIDQIWRAGSLIQAAGVFDTGPIGVEAERLVTERMITGISCDGVCTASEIVVTRKDDASEDAALEDEVDGVIGGDPVVDETYDEDLEYLFVATEYVIMGATICPAGAIAQARIDVVTAAIGDEETWNVHGRFEPSRCEVETQPRTDLAVERLEAITASVDAVTERSERFERQIGDRFESLTAAQMAFFDEIDKRLAKLGRVAEDIDAMRALIEQKPRTVEIKRDGDGRLAGLVETR